MKRWYITFGGVAYDETTALIVERATKMGADEVYVYDDAWLETQEFRHFNDWLWLHHGDRNNNKRGFGWFAWKPYILMHALDCMAFGDVVMYTDADTYPIADFSCLYDYCARDRGFFLFEASGHSNRAWVKTDCWVTMAAGLRVHGRRDVDIDSQHGVARFMLFQKGHWAVWQFLMEWLTYCVNPLTTTFDPSTTGPEPTGFQEHRTEQAIFTLLALKYGIPLHREADAFGNSLDKDRDLYPQLFEQKWAAGDRSDLSGSKYRRIPE